MKKSKTSILVIDDEPMILNSVQGILSDEDYKVFTAETGSKGLDILRRKNVDIVLLDEWMPGMDGIEALIKIKERHPETKVIVMSGHGTIETVVRAMQLGASDFIEKPLSLDKLLNTIEQNAHKKGTRFLHCLPGIRIGAAFYETICIYPGKKDLLLYLGGFCSERFFKVVVATGWTDISAIPNFIAIINPSVVKKRDWSILFDYLNQVPDTCERFVLSSKTGQPKIPRGSRKFFKTIRDRPDLGEYILYRSKKAFRRMGLKQKSAFIDQRRRDVKKILSKSGSERDFFIGKFSKYYNVTPETIERDLMEVASD